MVSTTRGSNCAPAPARGKVGLCCRFQGSGEGAGHVATEPVEGVSGAGEDAVEAHEAVDLPGIVQRPDGYGGGPQAGGVLQALVAQRVEAGGQHDGRGAAPQVRGGEGGGEGIGEIGDAGNLGSQPGHPLREVPLDRLRRAVLHTQSPLLGWPIHDRPSFDFMGQTASGRLRSVSLRFLATR